MTLATQKFSVITLNRGAHHTEKRLSVQDQPKPEIKNNEANSAKENNCMSMVLCVLPTG